jgi:16S rRNA (guanine527-N7)-methyltransferase
VPGLEAERHVVIISGSGADGPDPQERVARA